MQEFQFTSLPSEPQPLAVAPPWLRQRGESRQAYQAFSMYRDQRPGSRSMPKVAAQLNKSLSLLQRWSSHWKWPYRAEAWDAHLDRQNLAAQEEERKEMGRRQAAAAVEFQAKALDRLAELSPGELSPAQALDYFTEGAKVERLARAEPEGISEHRHFGIGVVTAEDLLAAAKEAERYRAERLREMAQQLGPEPLRLPAPEGRGNAGRNP